MVSKIHLANIPESGNVHTNSTCKQVSFLESISKFVHADAFFIHDVLCRATREQSGEFVVKFNESVGDSFTLKLVSLQD